MIRKLLTKSRGFLNGPLARWTLWRPREGQRFAQICPANWSSKKLKTQLGAESWVSAPLLSGLPFSALAAAAGGFLSLPHPGRRAAGPGRGGPRGDSWWAAGSRVSASKSGHSTSVCLPQLLAAFFLPLILGSWGTGLGAYRTQNNLLPTRGSRSAE